MLAPEPRTKRAAHAPLKPQPQLVLAAARLLALKCAAAGAGAAAAASHGLDPHHQAQPTHPPTHTTQGREGQGTPYGQQALAYLGTGANASAGVFAPAAVEAAYWGLYNPATCPGNSGGWYLDASTREFIENIEAGRHFPNSGGQDAQADGAAHQVAVTALLAGNTSLLLDTLEPVIRVTQDTQEAAAFGCAAARLLEKVLTLNVTGAQAVQLTAADLQDAARVHPFPQDGAMAAALLAAGAAAAAGEDASAFILRTGQSCDYFFTLPNVAFLVAGAGSDVAAFVSAGAPRLRARPLSAGLPAHRASPRNTLPLTPPTHTPRSQRGRASLRVATRAAGASSWARCRARAWAPRPPCPRTGPQKPPRCPACAPSPRPWWRAAPRCPPPASPRPRKRRRRTSKKIQ